MFTIPFSTVRRNGLELIHSGPVDLETHNVYWAESRGNVLTRAEYGKYRDGGEHLEVSVQVYGEKIDRLRRVYISTHDGKTKAELSAASTSRGGSFINEKRSPLGWFGRRKMDQVLRLARNRFDQLH